jgi:pimeloyl-ACP methyl ester carboxylesterase
MLTDLVNVTTSDGYRLDGALFVPAPGTAKTLNIDALICVHGATGNFYGPSFFEKAVERLLEHGVAVLRVNTRGHDIAFPTTKGYMGAAYEILDDSRKDLQSWLGFLEGRGYKAFGVWGHSLGAVKTVFCLAKDKDARVKVAAASSPPRFNYKNHAASDKGANFLNFVKKAEEAVAAGRPWELLMVDTPLPGLFSAGCYRLVRFQFQSRHSLTRVNPGTNTGPRIPTIIFPCSPPCTFRSW